MPKAQRRGVSLQPGLLVERRWVADCSMPWTPECEKIIAAVFERVFPRVAAEFASGRIS